MDEGAPWNFGINKEGTRGLLKRATSISVKSGVKIQGD